MSGVLVHHGGSTRVHDLLSSTISRASVHTCQLRRRSYGFPHMRLPQPRLTLVPPQPENVGSIAETPNNSERLSGIMRIVGLIC